MVKHLLLAALLAAFTAAFAGGTTKTDTIKVNGDCGMCEETIEKAAMLPGVEKAEWDMDAKRLTLTYNPKEVTLEAVQKSIAAKGYDTEMFKATDAAYQLLPQCCQYNRKMN